MATILLSTDIEELRELPIESAPVEAKLDDEGKGKIMKFISRTKTISWNSVFYTMGAGLFLAISASSFAGALPDVGKGGGGKNGGKGDPDIGHRPGGQTGNQTGGQVGPQTGGQTGAQWGYRDWESYDDRRQSRPYRRSRFDAFQDLQSILETTSFDNCLITKVKSNFHQATYRFVFSDVGRQVELTLKGDHTSETHYRSGQGTNISATRDTLERQFIVTAHLEFDEITKVSVHGHRAFDFLGKGGFAGICFPSANNRESGKMPPTDQQAPPQGGAPGHSIQESQPPIEPPAPLTRPSDAQKPVEPSATDGDAYFGSRN